MECNCKSSNRPDIGTEPARLVEMPKSMQHGEVTHCSIDPCIIPAIQHLWNNGIVTLNSCCSHNGKLGGANPSIVFMNGLTEEDGTKIRKLLQEVDDRDFDLLSWNLLHI